MEQSNNKIDDCDRIPSAKQKVKRDFVVEYWMPRGGDIWRKWKSYPTIEIAQQACDDMNRKHRAIEWMWRVKPQPDSQIGEG